MAKKLIRFEVGEDIRLQAAVIKYVFEAFSE